MEAALFIALFIIGALFFHASNIPSWFFGAGKPTEPYWKVYAIIAAAIWMLLLILANIRL